MELFLYNTVDGDNVLGKVLTNRTKIDIVLKSGLDIVNPIIKLTAKPSINFDDFNYMEIPYLNRYYFINGINNLNSKIFELECTCDVVETYKQQILNSVARFKRKLKNGDFIQADIDYSVIKTATLYNTDTQAFTDEKSIVLTTLGA